LAIPVAMSAWSGKGWDRLSLSTYERYDRVAAAYDLSRRPIGADIIADFLTLTGRPLSDVSLLDAGCGSGLYAEALVGQVGRLTAVDLSEGMLTRAGAKIASSGRSSLIRASIASLPFADNSLDAVMFNQVLHHLERGDDPGYGGHAGAIEEARRVLRPGGVTVINICSHEQLRHGFWYYDLIPQALDAALARCVPSDRLGEIIEAAGLSLADRTVPLDAVMQGAAYFEPLGPLDASWRAGDSIWALAPEEELSDALARVRALDADGALQAYLVERDAKRLTYGQFTFVAAVKT
jgi:ubiquinone/menaquinone biosynthesis C-methylase UbiE